MILIYAKCNFHPCHDAWQGLCGKGTLGRQIQNQKTREWVSLSNVQAVLGHDNITRGKVNPNSCLFHKMRSRLMS